MSNDHLVPVVIEDLVSQLLGNKNSSFTRELLVQRIEAIRDYCDRSLKKYEQQKSFNRK